MSSVQTKTKNILKATFRLTSQFIQILSLLFYDNIG